MYDNPTNLFVASFLGTPPINIFSGRVAGGRLYIGEDNVLNVASVEDQPVYIGIRPEGYIPQEAGPLGCRLIGVEVMGRDTSVVFSHPAGVSENMRAILSSDYRINPGTDTARFALKPNKVFLFRQDTEERLPFEAL